MAIAQADDGIENAIDATVSEAIDKFHALRPHLRSRHGDADTKKCRADCHSRFDFLTSAMRGCSPQMFAEYMRLMWVVLLSRDTDSEGLSQMAMLAVLREDTERPTLYVIPPAHTQMRSNFDPSSRGTS